MRAAAASLLAILVALAFAANASPGSTHAPRPTARTRLPAPITITSAHAAARIARDGDITRLANLPRTPVPPQADYFPGTDSWYEIQHGHLVATGAGAPRWRSKGLFPGRWRLGVVAASSQGVAFSYHGSLYVAPHGGGERAVARGEGAVGWTAGGVYTYGGPGNLVRLRAGDGTRIRTVARRPQEHVYDPATGTLYLIDHGVLLVAHGAHVKRVTTLPALGLPARSSWLTPLNGLIELMSPTRVVILRPDGSVFASTPTSPTATISSGLTVAPDRDAVAFTAAAGLSDDPDSTQRARGTETIYLLRAGSRHASPIHTERVAFKPCERGAGVAWHGSWLLYTNSEGNIALVDAAAPHQTIELTNLAGRALRTREVSASWT